MATTLYQSLASNWDAAIATGVSQTVQTAIQANAIQLTSATTLYIMLSGFATMYGRMTMQEWKYGASKAFILSILMASAGFAQWIQTPLMTTIPAWIATSVNGGFGATNGPQQFDALRDAVVLRESAILQQASGITGLGERLRAGFATWCICLELTVSFGIWELARGMMGLLVTSAPFLMMFYLFKTTQHVALNLLGSALSLLVLDLMVATTLAISANADNAFMNQSAAAGNGIEVQLDSMMNIALFFLFGMGMTAFLPFIAARIGHGVLPSAAPLVTKTMDTLQRAGTDLRSAASDIRRAASALHSSGKS